MSDDVIAGRYELLELVGRGGMSSVWKAHDRLLDRTVAIKVLHEHYTQDEEYVERFRREARSVAQVSHPNIVTVIDRGEDGGRQYIVFEYVDGENLKQVIEREGPLPVREALLLALQVARALGFAHDRGLVHRDVKPQNVLLNDEGQAKVTDFGIARSVDVDGVTVTGTVLGTSEYIAPEQARGQRVDAHTDVYSLGVVLYELLTGAVPFSGESFVTVALQHVNEAPPDVLEHRPDCPPRVALAIERAMAKEPEDRPMMDELVTELEACLADLDPMSEQATMIAPPRATRTTQPPRRRRRRRVGLLWPIVAVLLVLAVAALAALGATALRDNDNGSPAAASNTPIRLSGVAAYDPDGDGAEHDAEVERATDGDTATYWTTETYQNFSQSKPGVGIVLDAGSEVEPNRITVTTDTPGFQAEIRAGDSTTGPFRPVSDNQTVNETTTYELHDAKARYFVVWITDLDGSAHVNEVRAS